MRKSLKKILTAALGALAFVAAGFGVSGLKTANVAKAETAPLEIKVRTLVVSNNVNLSFFVPVEAGDKDDIKVLAREVRAVDGVEEEPVVLSALSAIHEEDTNGNGEKESFYEYKYKGVAAKEMPNVVYAYAYLDSDPTVKSPEKKFSIVEYAHKQLGQVSDKLDTLIKATLDYGEAAAAFEDQTLPADYLNDYKLWKLDESANATFADGFDYSYVYVGEVVNLKPTTGYVVADGMDGFTKNEDDTYSYTVSESLPDMSGVFVEDEGVSALDKVTAEKESLTLDFSEVIVGTTKELPTEASYPGVSITWSGDGVTDNSVTFNTVGSVTLTATISCEGTEAQTKEFTITVKENPYPVEGKAYALKAENKSVSYYATGINGTYLTTVAGQDGFDALSVFVKKGINNVYYIYYIVDETSVNYIVCTGEKSIATVSGVLDGEVPNNVTGWILDDKKIIPESENHQAYIMSYNTSAPRITTYKSTTGYPVVWFEEIRELTADEKIAQDMEALDLPDEVTGAKEIGLTAVGEHYGSTIVWNVTEGEEQADIIDGKLVIEEYVGAGTTQVKVQAVLSLMGATSVSKEFTIIVNPMAQAGEPVTASVTFSSVYSADEDFETYVLDDIVTLSAAQGSGSNPPKYYTNGYAIRVYGKNTFTITCKEGYKITSIIITTTSSNAITTSNCNPTNATMSISGTAVTLTPTNGSDAIILTNPNTNGNFRIAGISVTYEAV